MRSSKAGKNTQELLAISDPQELVELRTKIAQANLQQTASYAQNITKSSANPKPF